MKNVLKLVKRSVGILLLATFLLFVLNILLLFFMTSKTISNISPYSTADETAQRLIKTDTGYVLEKEGRDTLEKEGAWAFFIEDKSGKVVWRTDNTPIGISEEYSFADVSNLTLGYINDFPTYVGEGEDGILVVGYPKDKFWKSMYPSWDYYFIAKLPKNILKIIILNMSFIFAIYVFSSGRLLRSVRPITEGIEKLTTEKDVYIKEKGILSEVAACINRTSNILQSQKSLLKRKEAARSNWIAGVSHDIRTPLSMVMGYASKLECDAALPDNARKKAGVIVIQSEKIKKLIGDLNLSSNLEYNMQPIKMKRENAVSIVRNAAAELINSDIYGKYPLKWTTEEGLELCFIMADRGLLERAVSNLLQNSMVHNPNGCTVYAGVKESEGKCIISVCDDGAGMTEKQLEKLKNAPHYMVCDAEGAEMRHGLGLQIVRQITESHGGKFHISCKKDGGLRAEIILNKINTDM